MKAPTNTTSKLHRLTLKEKLAVWLLCELSWATYKLKRQVPRSATRLNDGRTAMTTAIAHYLLMPTYLQAAFEGALTILLILVFLPIHPLAVTVAYCGGLLIMLFTQIRKES